MDREQRGGRGYSGQSVGGQEYSPGSPGGAFPGPEEVQLALITSPVRSILVLGPVQLGKKMGRPGPVSGPC